MRAPRPCGAPPGALGGPLAGAAPERAEPCAEPLLTAPARAAAGPDPHRPARPLPARLAAEAALEAAMVDLAAATGGGAAELARRLRAAGFQASEVRPRMPGGRGCALARRS